MTRKLDLCSTCMHASDCTYRSKSDRYIYYCEEFEITPTEAKDSQKVAYEQQVEKQEDSDSSFKYKGLCVNCENRKTCSLARVNGGIWHCEEYR